MEPFSREKIDEYYAALLRRDSQYVGVFFAAVKTTLVFCIATCRARKPKKENVEFYKTYAEALKHGFRPCKICRPTESAAHTPEGIARAIQLVERHANEKVSDLTLRREGISPALVRRWFKKNYGITFHAFQRMYRINNAFKALKEGKSATETAFNLGYESLSGFGHTYKKVIGASPSRSRSKRIILLNRLMTPLGPMFVGATNRGICLLEFTDRKMLETEFRDLQKRLRAEILIGEHEHIRHVKKELKAYFDGKRTIFSSPLDTPGTEFQRRVWAELGKVSYGKTSTYQQLAMTVDKPTAVRAVARANGANRVAILVPCHRIVGKDGSLTGYGGGLSRKKWLLEFEAKGQNLKL